MRISHPPPSSRLKWGFLLASFVALLLAGTRDSGVERFGVPTDEWAYNIHSRMILGWSGSLLADPAAALSDSALDQVWKYAPKVVVHPPLSRELAAITFQVGRWIGLDGWRSFRLSNAIVHALLGVGLALAVWRIHPLGSLVVILGTLLNIRMHGHARTAQTDVLMTALWFAVAYSWIAACERRIPTWIPGVLLGFLLATKSTAILLLPALPFVGWVFWGRAAVRPGLFLAACFPVAMAFSPLAWVHPIGYWVDWLQKLTDRSSSALIPVGCLGRIWVYHAPAWVAAFHWLVVLPEFLVAGFLFETGLKVRGLLRRGGAEVKEAKRYLTVVAIAFVPMASQILASAPSHDLERLFLPSLPVAVLGTGHLAARLARMGRGWVRGVGVTSLAVGMLWAAISLWKVWPHPLAYYNGFIGGTRGAEALGMNSFYFKTEVGTDAIDSLIGRIPDSSGIGGNFIGGDLVLWSRFSDRIGRGIEVRLPSGDHPDSTFQDLDFWLVYNRRDHILALDRLVLKEWIPYWRMEGPEGVGFLVLYANPVKFRAN